MKNKIVDCKQASGGNVWRVGAILALGVWIVYFSEAWALVEYSESAPALRPNSSPMSTGSAMSEGLPGLSQSSGSVDRLGDKMFSFSSGFSTTNVSVGEKKGRIDTWAIEGRIDTPYQIWSEASYWMASSDDQDISENSGQQQGNPELRLGFNWLNMGPASYAARVDIFGGVSVAAQNSSLGSSRTDKIVGLSTSKRFESFVLGLGGELYLTGTPKEDVEMKIGNITKLSGMLGWVVSQDIRLGFEATNFKIRTGDADEADPDRSRLNETLSFGILSPKIALGLGSMVELELGAHLRTKDPGKDGEANLFSARLHNVPGAYGNTVVAGLGISL